MVMVDVGPAAYMQSHSPSWLAWSEGQRPLGAALHSSDEPGELLHDFVTTIAPKTLSGYYYYYYEGISRHI